MTWMRTAPIASTTDAGSHSSSCAAGARQDEGSLPEDRGRQPRVTPLATLLRALDGLLAAEDVPVVEDADREVWSYLSAFHGLTDQAQALHNLAEAFEPRCTTSPRHGMICTLIAQHRRRLAGAAL